MRPTNREFGRKAKENGNLGTERKIFLTKIFVPEMKSKDEFSELFISEVLEIIRDRNISVVPTAAIITKFIRKNRKYKSLLPVGIRI